jgi:outer membrane protein
MKNLPIVFSSLSLIGVLVLFGIHFSGDKCSSKSATPKGSPATSVVTGKIAYINIDSLEANYEYLKNEKESLAKRKQQMQSELQASADKMQKEYAEVQRRAQAGSLSQSEGEAAQKRFAQMQQSLESRSQSLNEQISKEAEELSMDLKKRLDSFIAEYNKDKNYDYILSYSGISTIVYANKQFEITADVIKGMNEAAGKISNTTKKK